MGTVYAIANQKGGVGKTTTAVNVAACIAEAGYEALLVDIDPQANATVGLGLPRNSRLAGSETRLRDALAGMRERFAFTLLDCPPSLGPLTVNALVAADRVIVPVQTEYFALEGLAGLLDTLGLVQR